MTAHLARHASVRPLEITTHCGKTTLQLEPSDTVVFQSELSDCPGCETGRARPVCVGSRHVAESPAADTCACGARKVDKPKPERVAIEADGLDLAPIS